MLADAGFGCTETPACVEHRERRPRTVGARASLVMTHKRNSLVVATLIASVTMGAAFLLWMEPGKPHWFGDALLMAERGIAIQTLRVECLPEDAAALLRAEPSGDGLCIIHPNQRPEFFAGGPLVRLVVVRVEGAMPRSQRQHLLEALGGLMQAGGGTAAVELHPASDPALSADLPAQASDLRLLLELKGLIATAAAAR